MNGLISQIMGPVVDVDFNGYLPKINEAIEVNALLNMIDIQSLSYACI